MAICRIFISALLILSSVNVAATIDTTQSRSQAQSHGLDHSIQKLRALAKTNKLNLSAFDNAFTYLRTNPTVFENKNYVTIIDYSQPSHQKRLYLFDLRRPKVFRLYVAHGRGSGLNEAKSFSNRVDSYKTSLGFLKTGEPYRSHEVGLALTLHGLEDQNSLVYKRGIVIHGAWYVSPKHIRRKGHLGRSLGCPAVEKRLISWLIHRIRGGSLIYSFHG